MHQMTDVAAAAAAPTSARALLLLLLLFPPVLARGCCCYCCFCCDRSCCCLLLHQAGRLTPLASLNPPPAGLIYTAGAIWNVLQKLNIPIHVQEVGSVPRRARRLGWACLRRDASSWCQLPAAAVPAPFAAAAVLEPVGGAAVAAAAAAAAATLRLPLLRQPRPPAPPSRQVCVFTAPLFSAFCAIATYLFMKEVRGRHLGDTSCNAWHRVALARPPKKRQRQRPPPRPPPGSPPLPSCPYRPRTCLPPATGAGPGRGPGQRRHHCGGAILHLPLGGGVL